MKRESLVVLATVVMAALIMSGCETVPKKMREEVSGIKEKVDTLETRVETVETKQADVERATAEHTQAIEDMKSKAPVPAQTGIQSNISVKSRSAGGNERMKDIQTALKNAGFYSGMIDGIKGTNTKKAIREFQRANGLRDDGIVGTRTWDLLGKYCSGAAQGAQTASSGGEDEGIK